MTARLGRGEVTPRSKLDGFQRGKSFCVNILEAAALQDLGIKLKAKGTPNKGGPWPSCPLRYSMPPTPKAETRSEGERNDS